MKIILSITILLIGITTADYFGYLGIKQSSELDYFNVKFTAEDEHSNEKLIDFYINCTRKGSRNACSIDQGKKTLERKVKFAIVKQVNKTWLFTKGMTIIGEGEVDVHLMFIHPNYERLTKTYSMTELLTLQNKTVTVKLNKSST